MAGEVTYTEDEAHALAWYMYQLGADHERMYHQTRERNIIDDYTAGYLAAIRGARRERQRGAAAMVHDDGEQQAMTSERLAAITRRLNEAAGMPAEATTQIERDALALLAEVERLRAALAAKADSYERLHLINMQIGRISRARQADLVAEREQAMEIVRAVAHLGESVEIDRDDDGQWVTSHDIRPLAEQARAALASTAGESERSGGDGA